MFSNKNLLCLVRPATNLVNIHSNRSIAHCSLQGTIPDFGIAYYMEDVLTNIFSMALIQDLYDISYHNAHNTFTINTPRKDIHFSASVLVSTTTTAALDTNPSQWFKPLKAALMGSPTAKSPQLEGHDVPMTCLYGPSTGF